MENPWDPEFPTVQHIAVCIRMNKTVRHQEQTSLKIIRIIELFSIHPFLLQKSKDITETAVVLPFSSLYYVKNFMSLMLSQVLQMLPLLTSFFLGEIYF